MTNPAIYKLGSKLPMQLLQECGEDAKFLRSCGIVPDLEIKPETPSQ
jgi:hypothetical protein